MSGNYITKVSREHADDRWLAECLTCDWKRTYVHYQTGSRKAYRHWQAAHQGAWMREQGLVR